MDNKYKFIGGFTVSDNYEAKKLKRLAKRGWILEDISGGMFYKFRKDKPQDITYNIDYNHNADDEYFDKFKEKGWDKVLSFKDTMHIFSSKKDNKEFTSDLRLDRHIIIQGIIGNQIKLWGIVILIIAALIAGSMYFGNAAFFWLLFICIIPIAKFLAIIADYYIYHERIKAIKKYGNSKESAGTNKAYTVLQVLAAVLELAVGIYVVFDNGLYGAVWLLLAALSISNGIKSYKKYKKYLEME